jgi:hypothetical protein
MTTHSLPPQFDLPPERFEAHRQLIVRTVASKQQTRARVVRPRLVLVAAALLLAVLLATPAFGIGGRIFDVFDQPSPSEAQQQTGVPPTVHLRTDYDGIEYSVITYHDAQGRPCFAEHVGSRDEGQGVGWGCGPYGSGIEQVRAQFADGSPVALLGPTWMQEPSRPGFDPTKWDRMSLDGVTKPAVVRLELVMTDCSTRHVPFDPDSFDGNGVFLYTVPRADLHAGIWPYKLVAYNAAGDVLSSQPIPRDVPATPAAHDAHTQAPQPLTACR